MDISAETLVAYQLAFTFLSKAFYEPPTSDLLNSIVTDDLFADWPLESASPETQAGLNQLRAFCRQWEHSQLADLKRDYASLFIGPNHLLAPPWESVYRSKDHLIFERQTFEVQQQYEKFGMTVQHSYVEPDDHIGLELRFAAHLCGLALFALNKDDSDLLTMALNGLGRFLNDHLLRWTPEFLGLVLNSAHTPYYKGIGHLTLGCLQQAVMTFTATQPVAVTR